MKPIIILFIALFSFTCVQADDALPTYWKRATAYYQAKNYDSAASFYERLVAQGISDATLYYNLGNAYYRLNKIAPAILNYERALKIEPDFKQAHDNLLLTQMRIPNKVMVAQDIFFISWWKSMTNTKMASFWTYFAFLVFLVMFRGLVQNIIKLRKSSPWPNQLIGFLAFMWVITMVLAYVASSNAANKHQAIVMKNDAPLLQPEAKSSKPLSLIPEGTKIRIMGTKGEYAEVALTDGRKGLMALNNLTLF